MIENVQLSAFYALIARMKYIDRWALMRNSRSESLAEHSLEVALIAHGLATIGRERYGKSLDAERAAVVALFHDSTEIITGDMPTPVKYANGQIKTAFKDVEHQAAERLLATLPADVAPAYADVYAPRDTTEDAYLFALVKAADKLSALIKCIEERKAGNTEFADAEKGLRKTIDDMAEKLEEVRDFEREFLPAYGATLDELLG